MSIYSEIEKEREYQRDRFGNTADDTYNNPEDFVSYITHHATRWHAGTFRPHSSTTVDTFRRQMIKVAALAVAAAESVDRQRSHGKTFYEAA